MFEFYNHDTNEVRYKMGRTTGPTIGKAHGCRMVQQIYCSTGVVRSKEHAVVPYDEDQDMAFARPGDSGALIYKGNGEGCGMVWGGMAEQKPLSVDLAKVIVFTPLDAIYQDLSARLGRQYGEGKVQITWVV